MLAELRQWHDAFHQLFRSSRTSGAHNFCSTEALEVLYLATYILTASAFFETQTDFDKFIPHFTTIVDLCRDILSQTSANEARDDFSLDSNIVCPLFLVGLKCRDPLLRREAINLLAKSESSGRGLWAVDLLERLLLWVVVVEEEGMEGSFVREESRVWNCNVLTLDPGIGKRRSRLQCRLFLKGYPRSMTTGSIMRETVIEW